jgi:hypothetical protein
MENLLEQESGQCWPKRRIPKRRRWCIPKTRPAWAYGSIWESRA